ncbi:hypothetical protein [Pseudomonas sp. UBA2684]|uniref:hypothetical protein n=1 Tax=Pseudomonas sp. UBA2684 TaxID=1947311 RepID=UPI000E9319D0|nr:hypothetical protein [Pseudomonas sp. UBA2684]HBX57859.1 hypothetical protein [Pseudomonas sp.]|tara:strand:- start:13781 stop:14836 length:1056 start_codon:yes stop_codon:yes gene_type:complete
MRKLVAISVAVSALSLNGCTLFGYYQELEAETRIVTRTPMTETLTLTEKAGSSSTEKEVLKHFTAVCPEASPDALKTFAASAAAKHEAVEIAAAFQESGANIGLRTHSIQLLRDQLYSICQAYANRGISKSAYQMMLTRNQRNTVALMAIEQLTGVVRSPNVTLSSQSSAEVAADLGKTAEVIAEQKAKFNALSETEQKAPNGVSLKNTIESLEKGLQTRRQAFAENKTTVESATPASTFTPNDQTIQTVTQAVKEVALNILNADDKTYICLDILNSKLAGEPNIKAACLAQLENVINNDTAVQIAPMTLEEQLAALSRTIHLSHTQAQKAQTQEKQAREAAQTTAPKPTN